MICFFHWACQFLFFLGRFTVFWHHHWHVYWKECHVIAQLFYRPPEKPSTAKFNCARMKKSWESAPLFFRTETKKGVFVKTHLRNRAETLVKLTKKTTIFAHFGDKHRQNRKRRSGEFLTFSLLDGLSDRVKNLLEIMSFHAF